ncbi:DUF1194 domain-containing protein [Pseudahrensia aquimaris]|uniref:DUF1194 domain-containing protein n=1 Tax=Pseudahrensia aquimaris TaxID=744461 RepID=A0ABW3FE30_9HYPH
MPHRVAPALALATLLLASPAHAQSSSSAPTPVDVELFLAVDVSRSMSPRELEIQRRGYAEALASDEVTKAITSGIHGKVAITYVEWAGFASQRTIVPWTLIDSAEDARAFALKLTAQFNPSLRRTSLSGAIDYATAQFTNNGYQGLRRVIDISGDGPNNDGRPVVPARDKAVAAGFVINGLPLMTRDGMGARWHLDDLDDYYRECVVGGPASFVIPVRSWDQFPSAVRQKLVLELAGKPPPSEQPKPIRAFYSGKTPDGYDCMIGEKIWQQMRDLWSEPNWMQP